MKILFASDISFNDFRAFPGEEKAAAVMAKTAAYFRAADFSVVNLENIVGNEADYTPIVKSGPNLISEEGFLSYIDALRPTAVGLANNHAGDFGAGALMNTIRLLKEKGYQYMGAGRNIEEAYEPAVFEKDGLKAAVIAVCENEFGGASDNEAGSAGYRLGMVTAAIRKAKESGCVPIIYFHGGNEHYAFPSPGKNELYRHFIDLGAGAVIAMHTHCPQGYEFYNGCPIVYSMGNFYFPVDRLLMPNPAWWYGYMVELELTAGGCRLEVIPYTFSFDAHTPLEGKEKEDFLKYLEHLCEVIPDRKLLCEYFDGWCMISGAHSHLDMVHFTENMYTGGPASVKVMRNLFSCEAHNELLRYSLQLMYEDRLEEAGKRVEEIKRLQQMKL